MKILYNARIYTLDQARPTASVLVIDRERIAALGGAELLEQFGARASREDMGGQVILPGFTDAHIHLTHYALSLQKVDVETPTKAQALQRVAQRAAQTPPGEWVLGHGWQQNDWDGQFPTAAELDAIAPHHPVYLTAKSLHAGWANSAALHRAGITASTPNPLNGKIVHNAQGTPNGILLESAMQLLQDAIPAPSATDLQNALLQAQTNLFGMGIIGAHDFDYRDCFMALQNLDAEHKLKLRVTKSIPLDLLPQAAALGLRTGFGSQHLRIGSVKAFMDGALGPRTAAMFAPYENEPENKGILNMDGEELLEYSRQAAQSGLSMAVHAIGDRAVHETLQAYQRLRAYEKEQHLPALRHRIEHVQVIHPQDAARLGAMGITASMQPIHATSDMYAAERYWGERARLSYAWKTQLNAGALPAFGSDAPVESPNPFWGIHAALTRRRANGEPSPQGWQPQEQISLQEALQAYTTSAAYAAGWEETQGRLSPGFDADLITLTQDPFHIEPQHLHTLQPNATMIAGEWVWQA